MTRDPRELIRHYRESEWRTTRLEVLRQLGEFRDTRSFHFLTQIVLNPDDVAEQQLAIASLGRRKTVLARMFLRNFYPQAPDTLKASLAHALGVSQDLSSTEQLLKDWDEAETKQEWVWLRNIVLSLGELKGFAALPKITSLLRLSGTSLSNELLTSALFSMGKLSRSPEEFQMVVERYESRFAEDGLVDQIYQSALLQVQIRSQFKLEDYLNKIFSSPDPHPILPLELLSFDPAEVEIGLSVFSTEKDWQRFLFALRGVTPERRQKYILQIARTVKDSGTETDYALLFESLREFGMDAALKAQLENLIVPSGLSLESRLKWLEVDGSFITEAATYLKGPSEEMAIRWINGWDDDLGGHLIHNVRADIANKVDDWIQLGLSPAVYGRLMRACAELHLEVPSILNNFETDFKVEPLRASLLLYLEKYPASVTVPALAGAFAGLSKADQEKIGGRILSVMEVFAHHGFWSKELEPALKAFYDHANPEFRVGVVRVLRHVKTGEPYLLKQLEHPHEPLVLNTVIALKEFGSSPEASEALIPFLKAQSPVLRGRALDALCSHHSLKAKQAVMEFLKENLDDEFAVDKIYRSFDPNKKGGEGFVKIVEEILKQNPDHMQWEKLVALRDRLILNTKTTVDRSGAKSGGGAPATSMVTIDALKALDLKLSELIPKFTQLDPAVQSALRAAEQPFLQSMDLQNLPVDKAPTVLEYCKALDLILDRHLGQKYLFPRLDQNLHDFQTFWHKIGFSEDYPNAEKVLNLLSLKGKVTVEGFPLHKAKLMCATFFNGKIVQDRFKVFDGLRAWAVIFLIFARKVPGVSGTPLLGLGANLDAGAMNEQCISIAKRLMTLQDLRNPAAHRQTYTELHLVKNVRNEAILLVNTVLELVL